MKVILLQNIKGFGRIGDIKNVSDGHAKNFLFPKKLAKTATNSNLVEAESLKKRREAEAEMEESLARKTVETLKTVTVVFTRKASSAGRLFSSVTKEEVAREVSKAAGARIDQDMIQLDEKGEHLKQVGDHTVKIELMPSISGEVTVSIKPE